jgi:hypothetical protein
MLMTAVYPTDDVSVPGNQKFLAAMKALGQKKYDGDFAKSSWVGFDLLNYAAKGLATISRSTILNALDHVTSFSADGLTMPLNFTKPGPNATYPRITSGLWNYFPAEFKNGAAVAQVGAKLLPMPPVA